MDLYVDGVTIPLQQDPTIHRSVRNGRMSLSFRKRWYEKLIIWNKMKILRGPYSIEEAREIGIVENPTVVVEKPDGSVRPATNCSFPKNKKKGDTRVSINESIPEGDKKVKYTDARTITQHLDAVKRHYGVDRLYMWSADIEKAFLNLYLKRKDKRLIGLNIRGKIFILDALPFGLAVAPKEFTRFMGYVLRIVRKRDKNLFYSERINIKGCDVNIDVFREDFDSFVSDKGTSIILSLIDAYVDDIYGFHISEEQAQKQFQLLKDTLEKVSLKLKEEKSNKPHWIGRLLGIIYDTLLEILKACPIKVGRYIKKLQAIKAKKTVQGEELYSAVGQVRHVGGIYRCINAFARGMEAIIFTKPLAHYHNVNRRLREDIDLCIEGLISARDIGVPWKYILRPAMKGDIVIYGDAALTSGGIGGYMKVGPWERQYIMVPWSEMNMYHSQFRDIVWRELSVPFVWLALLKKYQIHDVSITIYSDNEGVVGMGIKRTSSLKRPECQTMLREMCRWEMRQRWHVWYKHVPGKLNDPSDALSREDWKRAFAAYDLSGRISAHNELQYAIELCKGVVPKRCDLIMTDE